MNEFEFDFDEVVQDTVTKFKGKITGRVEYKTGSKEYFIETQVDEKMKFESKWINEKRLEKI